MVCRYIHAGVVVVQLHGGAGRDGGRGLLPAGAERAGVRRHLPAARPPEDRAPPPAEGRSDLTSFHNNYFLKPN